MACNGLLFLSDEFKGTHGRERGGQGLQCRVALDSGRLAASGAVKALEEAGRTNKELLLLPGQPTTKLLLSELKIHATEPPYIYKPKGWL